MAEVERDRIARGTKIMPAHTHGDETASPRTGLRGAGEEMVDANIDRDQMTHAWAPFDISVQVPWLGGDYYKGAPADNFRTASAAEQHPWGIQFHLIPPQDLFSITRNAVGYGSGAAPAGVDVVLDAIHISWDQRSEPAAIRNHYYLSAAGRDSTQGNYDTSIVGRTNIKLALLEKSPVVMLSAYPNPASDGEIARHLRAERSVFSADIPADAFLGDSLRFNPYVVSGIGEHLRWYRTYTINIYLPEAMDQDGNPLAGGAAVELAFPSFQVDLVCRCPLMSGGRNSGLQNIPTRIDTAKSGLSSNPVPASPAAGAQITADDSGGVDNALGLLDEEFQRGLRGGVDPTNSDVDVTEHVLHDAAYFLEVVPIFHGRKFGGVYSDRVSDGGLIHQEPWYDYGGGAWYALADRARWAVRYPMEIHHVLLNWNTQDFYMPTNTSAGQNHTSPTLQVEAGLVMLTGPGSSHYTYEDIANLTLSGRWTTPYDAASDWGNGSVIDRQKNGYLLKVEPDSESHDLEIFQMPIVGTGTAGANGYYAQGPPFFVGPSWRPMTNARSQVGNPAADPNTAGGETFLEARIIITDTDGGSPDLHGAQHVLGDIFVGYQGHAIQIIGKKYLSD